MADEAVDAQGVQAPTGGAAEEAPAAVRVLAGQDAVNVLLPDARCGFGIIPAVQGDQCPDGAVQALPDGLYAHA